MGMWYGLFFAALTAFLAFETYKYYSYLGMWDARIFIGLIIVCAILTVIDFMEE
ncbi:hypothetical protein HYT24_00675 [Candidatus Pacearchaeota archaeon]|nr:hypothetical protein [Candidatus Pacearchaeota archaeon]